VNDDGLVSVWQDVFVENVEKPPDELVIDDVETLKAMADPTRLAIMSVLNRSPDLPVMSVKEIAAELGEPQTKLYRHIKQLEAAGLIRVAATRMVSGILEQRYQATHLSMRLGRKLFRQHPAELSEAFHTVFDMFLDGFIGANQREAEPDEELRPTAMFGDAKVSPQTVDELRRRLKDLWEWLEQRNEPKDGVTVHLLTGFYVG
jgi:DNA-binding transcriptional ArsR family regulator